MKVFQAFTVEKLKDYKLILLTYERIKNSKHPDIIALINTNHKYPIKHCNELKPAWVRTNTMLNNFNFQGPKIWTCLPQDLKLLNNCKNSKKKIKVYFITKHAT